MAGRTESSYVVPMQTTFVILALIWAARAAVDMVAGVLVVVILTTPEGIETADGLRLVAAQSSNWSRSAN